jgi:type I restriction enzyme, S subunit
MNQDRSTTITNSQLKESYKQTEIGVIPEDWKCVELDQLNPFITSGSRGWADFYSEYGDPFVRITNMFRESISLDLQDLRYVNLPIGASEGKRTQLYDGDLLISITADIGIISYVDERLQKPAYINQHIALVRFDKDKVNGKFISYFLSHESSQKWFRGGTDQGAKAGMSLITVRKIKTAIPPLPEQEAISCTLSDIDALIESLDRLLTKKRQIKQGAMQELLRSKDGWIEKIIIEVADCLDNLRVPLNDSQRANIKGDYPYCGANGILDYINDYCMDDSVILIAEDGGYFDEYATRPIAYKMLGKFWVNNHAHVLKIKAGFDQNFVFYSLVHKNILCFLSSGTRAKLNKSEMNKISISLPKSESEQIEIANILSDMDAEIGSISAKLAKTRQLKQGMMHELLTGRIRLVENRKSVGAGLCY